MSASAPSRSNSFLALISLPATAMGFGLAVQISALSWILSTQYQLDLEQVGFVWLAGPVAGIIGQLLAGVLSDRIWFLGGRRRPLIIIGSILAALMLFLLPRLGLISEALAGIDILYIALSVALMLDLAINVGFNPTRSLIADLTAEGEERTRGFTIMQFISGFFGVAAYFLALSFGKVNLIYIGVGVMLLFNLIPLFFFLEPRELRPAAADTSGAPRTSNQRQLWFIYIAHGFSWIGVQTMFVFLYAYVQQKMGFPEKLSDAQSEELGIIIDVSFLLFNSVAFLLPAVVLAPLSKRFGRVRVHAATMAIMAVAYLGILAFGGWTYGLYLMMFTLGIGWGSIVSMPFAIATEFMAPEKTGLYMGIFNLSVVIPQIIVSGAIGPALKASGEMNLIFVISAVCLAISAALWLVLVRDRPQANV